ncbi:PqiC family protein [Piscinibacter sp.]|uniref:PqiC family protein n=1 Tax=Piscinibacter sp. TaxID=1903157 RepID=UPI002CB2D6A8|nr:PqiC family protein [Albitalea sp.]HUG25118.1 PqiC family protein [Albitalea sp.]
MTGGLMRRQTHAGAALAAAIAGVLLLGCASPPPERFHTLLASDSAAPQARAGAPIYVDLRPVSVPAQVDHSQWLLRQSDDSLLLLEQDRWAAPLAEELRGALASRLAARWGAIDVRGVAIPAAPIWRVRVDVQRFESLPAREARIESTWSLSSSQRDGPTLVCRHAARANPAGGDVAALAAAHRQAVTALADAIGTQLSAVAAGGPPGCIKTEQP